LTSTERRKIGAHYTSERDILKVIRPLFLDGLRADFDLIQADRSTRQRARLDEFRQRLSQLRFLDPACGCGNFLVIAYRELRALELEVLRAQHGAQQALSFDEVNRLSTIDVDQFYGIEIEEWPARIAEVALWLMDHQSNMRIHEAFGQPFLRLPLKNSPHILNANALRMDWNTLLPAEQCSYVMGNPPFVGHHYQSGEQKADQRVVMRDVKAQGVLDYVSNWYLIAANYIAGKRINVAFVSTNSVCQGEQAGILWGELFARFPLTISFAYQTFSWQSEARGAAHVHVVIVGLTESRNLRKYIYENAGDTTLRKLVSNISPYLVAGPNRVFLPRSSPLCEIPRMFWGNKPTDGGHLILSEIEAQELLEAEPKAMLYVRRYMSGGDFLNGAVRYCLWLLNASPAELQHLPMVRRRLEAVATFRRASTAATTRAFANRPMLFRQVSQPLTPYLAVPEVSSERRGYIPMALVSAEVICSNTVQFIPNAENYHFGVLTSAMHMAWVKRVAGRLKSDFRYSNTLVYNNYPWPVNATDHQKARVEELAQAVLDVRARFPDSTLAALYDPLLMPPDLLQAHHRLDRAVERCYRPERFANDQDRVEFLFGLYEVLTAPLLPVARMPRRRGVRSN
jgi:hypothetical protein